MVSSYSVYGFEPCLCDKCMAGGRGMDAVGRPELRAAAGGSFGKNLVQRYENRVELLCQGPDGLDERVDMRSP